MDRITINARQLELLLQGQPVRIITGYGVNGLQEYLELRLEDIGTDVISKIVEGLYK